MIKRFGHCTSSDIKFITKKNERKRKVMATQYVKDKTFIEKLTPFFSFSCKIALKFQDHYYHCLSIRIKSIDEDPIELVYSRHLLNNLALLRPSATLCTGYTESPTTVYNYLRNSHKLFGHS